MFVWARVKTKLPHRCLLNHYYSINNNWFSPNCYLDFLNIYRSLCNHFDIIYMCGRSAPQCVCLAVPNTQQSGVYTPNFNKTSLVLWENFYFRHFAYINNLYNTELGHKSHDQCLIRNIKHWGTFRKVLLADCCIVYTKIQLLKCKVVKPPHFSPKLIEYILD